MTNKPNRTHLSAADVVNLNTLLSRVMFGDGDEHKFIDGWDDERVRSEFAGGKFSLTQIKKTRQSLGYKMPRYKSIVSQLIEGHNKLIDAIIEAHVRGMVDYTLIRRLGEFKVADVRTEEEKEAE